jgi:hypothetical protein
MKLQIKVEYLKATTAVLNSDIEIDLELLKTIVEERRNQFINYPRAFNLNDLENIISDEIYGLYADDYLPNDSLDYSEEVDMLNLNELVEYFKYLL